MSTKAKEFFDWKSTPFTKDVGFKQLFRYSQVEELFEILGSTVEDGSMALVASRAGTGKTTAVRAFLETLPANRYRSIYLGYDRRGSVMMARFAHELGVRPNMTRSNRMLYMTQHLQDEMSRGNRQLVVVLDEAHLFEKETLEDIRLLTNADMDRRSPMAVIVLGQHWLRNTLKSRLDHEALYQRLRLRYSLEGLTEEETRLYVDHHLTLSGCKAGLFDDDALALIFNISEGILREINNLGFESLMRAASQRRKTITEEIVRWVIDQREVS